MRRTKVLNTYQKEFIVVYSNQFTCPVCNEPLHAETASYPVKVYCFYHGEQNQMWAVTSNRYFDNSIDLWVIDIKREMTAEDDPHGIYLHAPTSALIQAQQECAWLAWEGMVNIL